MSREVCGICWCPYDENTRECACAPEPEALPQRTPEECIDVLLQRMNISELAQAIGVDASAISHVKAGRSRITHYEKVDKLRSMAGKTQGAAGCGELSVYMGAAMNKEDIIRMALEANILEPVDLLESNQWRQDTIRELERFAHLVYEATFRDANIAASRTILDAAVLEERERCAQIADAHASIEGTAQKIAAEIRGQG